MSKMPTRNSDVVIIDTDHNIAHDVVIVTISAVVQGEMIECKGTAIRHPHDKFDADTGVLLATARAYESLAKKLHIRANGLVKHNDDVARHKGIIKANLAAHRRRRNNYLRRQARAAASS